MSKPRTNARTTRGDRRARHRRQEGVALLIIMIIIVITTAAAAASVRNTTAEMQAAGRERLLLQSRYAAEATLMATIAYIDQRAQDGPKFLADWNSWESGLPPETRAFTGGHQITDDNRFSAVRIEQRQLAEWMGGPIVAPVSGPDPAAAIPDLTGSFGPNQQYAMDPFIADITDCSKASGAGKLGSQVNAGPNGKQEQFDCTITLRGRISMVDALGNPVGAAVSWDLPGGLNGQVQDRSGTGYDMRATVKTPPVLVPSDGTN